MFRALPAVPYDAGGSWPAHDDPSDVRLGAAGAAPLWAALPRRRVPLPQVGRLGHERPDLSWNGADLRLLPLRRRLPGGQQQADGAAPLQGSAGILLRGAMHGRHLPPDREDPGGVGEENDLQVPQRPHGPAAQRGTPAAGWRQGRRPSGKHPRRAPPAWRCCAGLPWRGGTRGRRPGVGRRRGGVRRVHADGGVAAGGEGEGGLRHRWLPLL
mmetsp:Transcript_22952/g.72659  ORF Transcript_22952/g.72659 Transcript_22952/m.72659 type:complete len:213 (+) Transcript_22952:389-1027(+)